MAIKTLSDFVARYSVGYRMDCIAYGVEKAD